MKPIQVYLPEDVHRKLKVRAAESGTTVSDIVRDALERGRSVEEPQEYMAAESSPPPKLCEHYQVKGMCLQKGCKFSRYK